MRRIVHKEPGEDHASASLCHCDCNYVCNYVCSVFPRFGVLVRMVEYYMFLLTSLIHESHTQTPSNQSPQNVSKHVQA